MDREAWQATANKVTKESDTTQQLNHHLKLAQNTYTSLPLDKVIQRKTYFIISVECL